MRDYEMNMGGNGGKEGPTVFGYLTKTLKPL